MARIFSNLCTGRDEVLQILTSNNILDKTLAYLRKINTTEAIFQNIMHFIANLVGTNLSIRDQLLGHELFELLVVNARIYSKSLPIQASVVWLLSNVLRGKPFPQFNIGSVIVEEAIKIYKLFPVSELDTEEDRSLKAAVNLEAVWAISLFLEANDFRDKRIVLIHNNTILLRCLGNLDSDSVQLSRAALRILGAVTSHDNEICEELIDMDVLYVGLC